MSELLIREAEVDGRGVDVLISEGVIADVRTDLPPPTSSLVIDAHGGALLPGLWDHHIHLLALASSLESVQAGPPAVSTRDELATALRAVASQTPPGSWIRAVGYHESVAGALDRDAIDTLISSHPVRIQHRSGAAWFLNSRGATAVALDDEPALFVERTAQGTPTGRLFGADAWLRDRLPPASPPDLTRVGSSLAARGVVGVTDATPFDEASAFDVLSSAAQSGALPQRITVMGGASLAGTPTPATLARGPVKILLADHALGDLDTLVDGIRRAHDAARPVAIHCVTRAALALAVAAWHAAGTRTGDRIEHGGVVPPELRDIVRDLRLIVVTQPNFISERGDEYRAEVDPDDLPHLYPCASLIDAGIAVAGSTDAPFGHPDPWRSIDAAIHRSTPTGVVLGAGETLSPRRALELFLGPPDDPGGRPRAVVRGAPADLCLLHDPLEDTLAAPRDAVVRATLIGGRLVHDAT